MPATRTPASLVLLGLLLASWLRAPRRARSQERPRSPRTSPPRPSPTTVETWRGSTRASLTGRAKCFGSTTGPSTTRRRDPRAASTPGRSTSSRSTTRGTPLIRVSSTISRSPTSRRTSSPKRTRRRARRPITSGWHAIEFLLWGQDDAKPGTGWKANQPSLRQQSADAFLGDMGLTSSLFPNEECTAAQVDCKAARSGGSPELSDALLASVVTYSHLLAVPARRHWKDSVVRRGKDLFGRAGCTGCHLLTSASSGPPCTSASSSRPSTSVASRPASCSRAPPTSCTGRPSPTPSRDPTPSARPSGSIRSCR